MSRTRDPLRKLLKDSLHGKEYHYSIKFSLVISYWIHLGPSVLLLVLLNSIVTWGKEVSLAVSSKCNYQGFLVFLVFIEPIYHALTNKHRSKNMEVMKIVLCFVAESVHIEHVDYLVPVLTFTYYSKLFQENDHRTQSDSLESIQRPRYLVDMNSSPNFPRG